MAYKYAKEIKKETKEQSEIHKGMINRGIEGSYEIAGLTHGLERNNTYQQIKYVAYDSKCNRIISIAFDLLCLCSIK